MQSLDVNSTVNPEAPGVVHPVPPAGAMPQEPLDRLVRLASRLLDAPAALVTLSGRECQHPRGSVGLAAVPGGEAQLAACCRLAAAGPGEPLEADDAGPPGGEVPGEPFRAWLAVPLAGGGRVVGALCVADTRARRWSEGDRQALCDLAAGAAELIAARRAAERIRRSERLYRGLFEQSRDGVFITGRDGETESFNDAILALTGYSRDELSRMNAVETYADPADRQRFREALERDGSVQDFEVRVRRKDGSVRDVIYSATVRRREDGEVVGYQGIVHDISDRKRAERELRASRELFQTAFEHAPIGMALVALDGGWLDVNAALSALVGYSRAELLGRTFQEITHPDDLDADLAHARQLLAGEIPSYQFEKRYIHRDGHPVWGLLTGSLLRDEAGEPLHFIAQIQDITARREAEAALARSEALYRSLTENAHDMVTILDGEGAIAYDSPALETVLGYGHREWIGRPVLERVHPDDRERVEGFLRETLARPGENIPFERRARRADGSWRWLDGVGRNLLGDPAVRGIVTNSRDVTDRVEVRSRLEAYARELERSNRELQDFAYVASHDLQEPLRKIHAFGDRLAAQHAAALGDQGQDLLRRMQAAARRMQTLIQDLLAYSRVGTRAEPFVPVDLARVAGEVIADLQASIDESGGRVEVGPLPPVRADAMQMRQLLQNLIGNALKFHREGVPPLVRLTGAEAAGGTVELRVEDNGIGFDPRYRDRIFTPFERLHARTAYEGTGMGLAICRKIVHRHGGEIGTESAPGEGAAFIVTLPAHPHGKDAA